MAGINVTIGGAATIGSSCTVTVTEQYGSYDTYTLEYLNTSGTYVTIASNKKLTSPTTTWTPPTALCANATADSELVWITFRVSLFAASGGGATSQTARDTAKLPASALPTVSSVTTSDTNGYLAKYGGYVQGKSQLQTVVNGSGIYSSTIQGYSTTFDSTTKTTKTSTFTPNIAGTRTISAKVTDSRGRTSNAKTSNITVLAYAAPKVTSLQADRCDSEGNADSSGAYIKVVVNGSVSSLNSKNTKTERFRYKTSTSSTWSSWQTSGTIFAANVDYAYDIQAQVVDDFATTSQTTQVPGTFVLVDYGGMTGVEGTGLAFGGAATKANTFLNYLDLEAHGEVKVIDSNRGYADIVLGTNNYKNSFIRAYDNGTIYGHDMLIQSGAGMIIGAGEYPTNRYALGNIKDTENMYLGADGNVFVETNANTVGNRSTFQFGNNSFLLKTPLFDMSKADNGVSATVYPSTVEIQDSGGRRMLRMEGIVNPTGSVGSAWYLRNFDTSGAQVAQKGIRLFLSKAGALTYQFDDVANARSALGFSVSSTAPATTNSTGFELSGMTARKYGQIVQMLFQVKTTNALTANTNYTVANITPAGYRPAIEAEVIPRAAGSLFRGYIQTGGNITIRPNVAIAAGSTVYCWAMYIAATF